MSLSKQPLRNNSDNIWQRHASEIRHLYQTTNFNEMKHIMETKYGFPKFANKTWNEKLGILGIRKTLTNDMWCKVYQHCARHRLEDPSRKQGDKRLNRTKRPTEVVFGDITYSWKQAWRNMKNARAIAEVQFDPPSPLPPDITVRTPPIVPSSPRPCVSLETLQPIDGFTTEIQEDGPISSSECGLVRKDDNYFNAGGMFPQQFHLLEPSPNNALQPNYSSPADYLRAQMPVFLPGLPIWNLSNKLAEMADLDPPPKSSPWGGATVASTSNAISSLEFPSHSGTAILNESVFYLSDLFSSLTIRQPLCDLATFSARHRAYLTVSMAMYLLSNNLASPKHGRLSNHKDFFQTLDSALREMPARHLRSLLLSRLASVRATFEALLSVSGILKQRFAFKSLVEIGTGNGWLTNSTHGHECLYHAICMDLDEVVHTLLESGCRPDGLLLVRGYTNVIFEALKRRKIHCAQLLLEHCDINSRFRCAEFGYASVTSFTLFVLKMNGLEETIFNQGIRLFLDSGAEIESQVEVIKNWATRHRHRLTVSWSALDILFCFHPPAFYKFAPNWSPSEDLRPTRAGVLTSMNLGRATLNEYCHKLAQHVGWEYLYEFLELLVLEELTGLGPWHKGPPRVAQMNAVYALVDLGVSMDKVLSLTPNPLEIYIRSREQHDMEVIRFLLDNGVIWDEQSLTTAFEMGDTDLLAFFTQDIAKNRQLGPQAVVIAAIHNKFEVVKALLDAGVDVNTDIDLLHSGSVKGHHQPASLLCQIIELWEGSFEDLNNMIYFLVQRGAHLRLSAIKPSLPDLMESVLRYTRYGSREGVLKGVVRHIISLGCDVRDPGVPSARLLEACGFVWRGQFNRTDYKNMEIFELLFRNGARLRPGAPLAAWIQMGGGAQLVKEMLCGGVDIDAYYHNGNRVITALQAAAGICSEELVLLLLEKGADVNAPAGDGTGRTGLARYETKHTALQAICGYEPLSPAEQAQQVNIINLLLDHGADVNALARGQYGVTALQAICDYRPQSPAEQAQKLNIINLLVTHGANVNAAPARRGGQTALQVAAGRGYLEVTMLLLSSDLSADVNMPPCKYPPPPWSTYHIALDLAAQEGRLDTVKLLLNNNALSGRPGLTGYDGAIQAAEEQGHLAVAELIREHAGTVSSSNPTRRGWSQPPRDWREYGYDEYSDGYYSSEEEYEEYEEDNKNNELPEPGEVQDPVVQPQFQYERVEHPGVEHTAPEQGFVWEMGDDNSLNFNIGFGNVDEDMGGIYGLQRAPSTSNIDNAASGWGFG